MPTIFDIAKKAKVSVMTVSRVMNNPQIVSRKTVDRIHKIMDDLGYQPSQIARSLVKKRTNTIGVIMPDIKNTFFNNLFRYIEDYASSHDFHLLLSNTDEEPEKEMKYVKLFLSQRVDGIIISPCSNRSIIYLQKSKSKYICVDRVYEDYISDFVSTDHYQGAFQATEYLLKLGHKRIAVLRGSGVLVPDDQRFAGFTDAMEKYEILTDPKLIVNCEFDEICAAESVKKLLKQENKPTAIFSFNSLMMAGAIRTIRIMKKKIPADISLICFDEISGYEIVQPKITCLVQPIERIGYEATKAIIRKIKKQKVQRTKMLVHPKLILGESCKKV
jgi:LacI family transcriptional regulator